VVSRIVFDYSVIVKKAISITSPTVKVTVESEAEIGGDQTGFPRSDAGSAFRVGTPRSVEGAA